MKDRSIRQHRYMQRQVKIICACVDDLDMSAKGRKQYLISSHESWHKNSLF